MREEEYLQCINFGLLIKGQEHNQTIPIVLAIDDEDKRVIESIPNGGGDLGPVKKGVTLKYNNKTVAILDDYEIYVHRKEERAAAVFKTTNPGHPSIKMIMESGDWLIGGDLKVFSRITWNDGLDEFRLKPSEIRTKLKQMNVSAHSFEPFPNAKPFCPFSFRPTPSLPSNCATQSTMDTRC